MSLVSAARRSLSSSVGLLVLLAGAAGPAGAQTAAEAECRSELADSFRRVVKYAHRAVRVCHGKRDKGDLSASIDCNDLEAADLATGRNIAVAENRFHAALNAHCKNVPLVLAEFPRCPSAGRLADDGGTTTGIDSFDELSECLSVQLDDVLGRAAEAALGLPDVPLDRDTRRCRQTIAKSLGRVIDRTFSNRLECQTELDSAGGPIGFACATTDLNGEIGTAIEKVVLKIQSGCSASAAGASSCAATASRVATCAIREVAATAAYGLAAMAWELPGTCPGAVRLRFDQVVASNDVDTGWTGMNHDAVPVGGYDAAQYPLACDEDCANCTGSSPVVPADHCRCNGDASVECSTDAGCTGIGETCTCYLAPPTHVPAQGVPYCTMTPIQAAMAGSVDLSSGAASLDVRIRQRIGYGMGQTEICPVCTGGVCDGGARDGLACEVDAVDASFGDTSFDCPPLPGANLTGQGALVRLSLSTGPLSLPFALPCDVPFEGLACACSTCSLDNQIACNSDSECAGYGAGLCRTDGLHGGEPRRPNACSDQVCTIDPLSSHDGKCANGPDDRFCDGFVQANGRGVISCATNADCEVYDGICPGSIGGDCGACTIAQPRDCFLDPIEAAAPGPGAMVGGGCMPPTTKPSLNAVYGIPGPFRIRQAVSLLDYTCADGVTPYVAPGGSSCP